MSVHLILMVIAAILLLLAAIAAPLGRASFVSLGWLGMFFFVLDFIVK